MVCDWSYWIKFMTRFNNRLSTQIENVSLSGVPEVIFRQSYELFTAELNKGSCYVVLLARWASKENFGNALKSGWCNPANLLIASPLFLLHGHNWNTLPLLLSNRVCEKERRSTFGITAILMHRFPKAWGNTQTTIKISETSLFWVLIAPIIWRHTHPIFLSTKMTPQKSSRSVSSVRIWPWEHGWSAKLA